MGINNTPKRKILEISSYPPPRAGWGVRVSYVKKALLEQGHQCEVLNISPFSRKIPSPTNDYLTTLSGMDYVKKIITRRFKGYRIHMHMNGDSPKGFVLTSLAVIISLLTFKRPILTFHAGPYQKYFPQERAWFLTPVYKFIFTACGKIICNNQAVKEKIAGYGINEKKIIPIQAFSVQYLDYKPINLNSNIAEFVLQRKPLICSYVFFRPEFFIDRMVRAIAKVRESHSNLGLIILGSNEGSEEIKALIKEVGIEDAILFAGDQSHDSFLTIISKCDFFLRTPVKDGVCSSVLEALSLGVPVIASENNRRPPSVITYDNDNLANMVEVINRSISQMKELKKQIIQPEIKDTVVDELKVLLD